MAATDGLYELLLDRVTTDPKLSDGAGEFVLAAWQGEEALRSAVAGVRPTAILEPRGASAGQTQDVYLAAVHVAGFRGIGRPVTLDLRPGPGLTLVTGRNGSGKSSFAEAAELAIAGTNARWDGRAAVWRNGWENLHEADDRRVAVDLTIAGSPGTTRISHAWKPGENLTEGQWTIQPYGEKAQPYAADRWQDALVTYRPFLSYGELGAVINGDPKQLYDALFALLGLGALTAAQDVLRAVCKEFTDDARALRARKESLLADLGAVDDERAMRAAELLRPGHVDLAAVADIALGSDEDVAAIAALRQIARLEIPDLATIEGTVDELRQADGQVTKLATDASRSAERVTALLREAIRHREEHGDGRCPVCEQGVLDERWESAARDRADDLERTATALRDARARLSRALAAVRNLAAPVPEALVRSCAFDTAPVQEAWRAWHEVVSTASPNMAPTALVEAHRRLGDELTDLRTRADAELARSDEMWRPLARQLADWHDDAVRVRESAESVEELKAAEAWLKATSGVLRNERLAPFATETQRIWKHLRQQSNVDLGAIHLEGAARGRRQLAMDVRVDGFDGAALSVMSEGELHALGLALFLPRATSDESPFRFVVIDDPVQSMDPAKVDGLARVLSDYATRRQVVVFTHDDRLAEAVRRLRLPATIWAVSRQERSAVTLTVAVDPVERYIDDARAIAQTDELPDALRGELVANCCRGALEAAGHAAFRNRRIHAGQTSAEVEAELQRAQKLHQVVTLALFDELSQSAGARLYDRLDAWEPWAKDVFKRCKAGSHGGGTADLEFIRDVERLARWIEAQP